MRRYLALGDSYTIGEGVPAAQTWPHRLAAALSMTADVVARTGWSGDELLDGLEAAAIAPPYQLVSLLIGVNDQYRDRAVDEHVPHFNSLLNHAVSYADGEPSRVFVVSIPDWGVSAFADDDRRGRAAIAAAIDAYNAAQRELCALRGIGYADITPLSRALAGESDMFVEDRLHPSDTQYERWLAVILPLARACLQGDQVRGT